MRTRIKLAVVLMVAIFVIAHIYEAAEKRHQERFQTCMKERGYDYSDALCEECWEATK